MCAVRGAEGIHHEDLAQGCHLPCQGILAGFFAAQKAHIFKQYDLAGRNADAVDPVADQRHVASEQATETISNGL